MKQHKVFLALFLVICLFGSLFTACTKSTPAGQDASSAADLSSVNTDDSNRADEPQQDDSPAEPEEFTDLVVFLYDMRSTGADFGAPINEAVNNLLRERIQVELEIHWITPGDWATQAVMAISSGDRCDVMNLNPRCRVNNLYPQGLLLPLNDLLETYAPEALALCSDYIDTYSFDGNIWGLPTLRNYCKNGYILMNAVILDDLGLRDFAQDITSWSEYEQILQAVKEHCTDQGKGTYGLGLSQVSCSDYTCTGDSFDSFAPFDNLGDPLGVVYTDREGNVSLFQECDGFLFGSQKAAEWAEKGYQYPDSEYTSETVDGLMTQQVVFSVLLGSEYGVEATKETAYGYDIVCVQLCTGMIKTDQPQFTGVAIPVTAEEPEAACRFINELYTNSELMNLLIYGIEGTDYTIRDSQVVTAEGTHYSGADFVLGNSTILTPLMGNGADFYDVVKEINRTADKSPFLGFALDTGDMDLLMSQITAVTDQYAKNMNYGGYTAEKYQQYIDKLYGAGVQDYLDAVAQQLAAWRSQR